MEKIRQGGNTTTGKGNFKLEEHLTKQFKKKKQKQIQWQLKFELHKMYKNKQKKQAKQW